jgi:hypothetical protein
MFFSDVFLRRMSIGSDDSRDAIFGCGGWAV